MRLGCIQIIYLHKFLMSLLVRHADTHIHLNMFTHEKNKHTRVNLLITCAVKHFVSLSLSFVSLISYISVSTRDLRYALEFYYEFVLKRSSGVVDPPTYQMMSVVSCGRHGDVL